MGDRKIRWRVWFKIGGDINSCIVTGTGLTKQGARTEVANAMSRARIGLIERA